MSGEVFTVGDATLYHGDCLEILPTLHDVDAVITDPPFNAGRDFPNDYKPADKWAEFCADFAKRVAAIANNCVIEVGKNDIGMRKAFDAVMQYRWAIALDYSNGMRQGAVGYANWGLVLWYGLKCYTRYRDMISVPIVSSIYEFSHPSPKQVAHYVRLVDMFTPSDGLVVDPFLGSGTTGLASAQAGRKFIGIEIERKYFDIACERIDNAYRQQRMFA